MRRLLGLIWLVSMAPFAFGATTGDEVVDEVRVQVAPNGSSATYYFLTKDRNWSSADCPNAIYAYIPESSSGAKAIYAAALASKSTQTPIKFSGVCGNASGNGQYLQINYVTY